MCSIKDESEKEGWALHVKGLSGSMTEVCNSVGDYFLRTRKEGFKKNKLILSYIKLKISAFWRKVLDNYFPASKEKNQPGSIHHTGQPFPLPDPGYR